MIEGDVTIIVQADTSFSIAAIIEARDAAVAAAAAAALSETAADADATATAADRVQTGLDATATAADRVQTGLDSVAAAASAAAAAASAASIDPSTLLTRADNLASVANAATSRENLGVAIGSDVQAWDADLDAIAGLAGTGLVSRTGAGTAETIDPATYVERSDIVGTVSQASGVPTGAIIERGSNANGDFVKYADGTMQCWGTATASIPIDTSMLGGFRSGGGAFTFTFPATFIAPPRLFGNPVDVSCFSVLVRNSSVTETTGDVIVTAISSQGSSSARNITFFATGRWF